jgi:hypothetical protein
LKSKRWFWISIVLISLGLAGWLYFGFQVLTTKVEGMAFSISVPDNLVKSFEKFDCPWALNPGETGVATVVLPYPGLSNSIQVTGTRLNVRPVTPASIDSTELRWEITAQGGGNGWLVVWAPSELDRSLPESSIYWGSIYNQACSILVSVLGLPYRTYSLLCLFLTAAGVGSFTRWVTVRRKQMP